MNLCINTWHRREGWLEDRRMPSWTEWTESGSDAQGWSGMKMECGYVSTGEEYSRWDYEINPKF